MATLRYGATSDAQRSRLTGICADRTLSDTILYDARRDLCHTGLDVAHDQVW